jgi:thiol-disulfide isomerase/thioredoxin
MRRIVTAGRILDVLAIVAVLFLIYKLAVAPRSIDTARAYPAPRISYATLDGKPFVLREHRGRVVFLDFFASWCEPCKISLPMVERFARTRSDVDVIPIDVGEPRAVAQAFARAHHLMNVALDPQSLSQGFFQIGGFPTMVVVDTHGRIRATWTGLNPAIELNMRHAADSLQRSS